MKINGYYVYAELTIQSSELQQDNGEIVYAGSLDTGCDFPEITVNKRREIDVINHYAEMGWGLHLIKHIGFLGTQSYNIYILRHKIKKLGKK